MVLVRHLLGMLKEVGEEIPDEPHGFLVLNSPGELDVVAVYSGNPKGGEVSTLDTETIAARAIAKVIVLQPPKAGAPSDKKIQAEPFKPINP